jgi:DNA-binding transcriptional regulator GbsR (MarR family)
MFEVVLDQRKRREVDPTLATLREISAEIAGGKSAPEVRQRLDDMLGFFEVMDTWYGELRRMPLESRVKLVKLGTKLQKILR